jgi:hypothetical protein
VAMPVKDFIEGYLALAVSTAANDEERKHARETVAMFNRSVAWKRLTRACPHNGGWMHLSAVHIQCQSCGLVAKHEEWQGLVKWIDYPPEPHAPALGTELADWEMPPLILGAGK